MSDGQLGHASLRTIRSQKSLACVADELISLFAAQAKKSWARGLINYKLS